VRVNDGLGVFFVDGCQKTLHRWIQISKTSEYRGSIPQRLSMTIDFHLKNL
jgi:hypothetical protein